MANFFSLFLLCLFIMPWRAVCDQTERATSLHRIELQHSDQETTRLSRIARRQDADRVACPGKYPKVFSCRKDEYCISLAANTTVLCCPSDRMCSDIMPITCDISLQNMLEHPFSKIITAELTYKLPACGTGLCCPFGYSCRENGARCSKDNDQSVHPKVLAASGSAGGGGSTSATTPSKTTSTPTSHSPPERTGTLASSTPTSEPAPESPPKNMAGIIVGSSIAVVVFVAGALAVAWFKRSEISRLASKCAAQPRRWQWHEPPRWHWPRPRPWQRRGAENAGPLLSPLPTPPPPPLPARPPFLPEDPPPYSWGQHLRLSQCRQVPRRKTVPKRISLLRMRPTTIARPPTARMSFSPVELPATPVSMRLWARGSAIFSRPKSTFSPFQPPQGSPALL